MSRSRVNGEYMSLSVKQKEKGVLKGMAFGVLAAIILIAVGATLNPFDYTENVTHSDRISIAIQSGKPVKRSRVARSNSWTIWLSKIIDLSNGSFDRWWGFKPFAQPGSPCKSSNSCIWSRKVRWSLATAKLYPSQDSFIHWPPKSQRGYANRDRKKLTHQNLIKQLFYQSSHPT